MKVILNHLDDFDDFLLGECLLVDRLVLGRLALGAKGQDLLLTLTSTIPLRRRLAVSIATTLILRYGIIRILVRVERLVLLVVGAADWGVELVEVDLPIHLDNFSTFFALAFLVVALVAVAAAGRLRSLALSLVLLLSLALLLVRLPMRKVLRMQRHRRLLERCRWPRSWLSLSLTLPLRILLAHGLLQPLDLRCRHLKPRRRHERGNEWLGIRAEVALG